MITTVIGFLTDKGVINSLQIGQMQSVRGANDHHVAHDVDGNCVERNGRVGNGHAGDRAGAELKRINC